MEIAIVSAVRTAIGKFGGTLTGVPAEQLGAIVIKEALARAGVAPEQVSEVIMGCVLQAGLGQNPARQASIHAGVPKEVPAFTVNNVCGSGLKCVNLAASLIQSGEAEIIVAGGMENMSAAPYVLPGARFGYRMNDGKMVDAMVHDALWDAFYDVHMGVTAENIAFGVAPRINASGRLDTVDAALKVLISDNMQEVAMSVQALNEFNKIRQTLCQDTFLQADEMVKKEGNRNPAIILYSENWHIGIIGIVASKLVEKYYKPVFLMTYVKEKDQGGSGYIVINRDSVGGDDHTGGTIPEEAVEMSSDQNGNFTIYGLDQGVYYLKEVSAPEGYRTLTDPIVITVAPVYTDDRNGYTAGEGSGDLRIINQAGSRLPVTGSAAAPVLAGTGAALMVSAAAAGRWFRKKGKI